MSLCPKLAPLLALPSPSWFKKSLLRELARATSPALDLGAVFCTGRLGASECLLALISAGAGLLADVSCARFCGEGGIRTLGTVTRTHDFQSCTFGHSVTSPGRNESLDPRHIKHQIPAASPWDLAEREGFEPSVRFRTPDFESGTIDHSDISPRRKLAVGPRQVKGVHT